jgi:hypothetical protein
MKEYVEIGKQLAMPENLYPLYTQYFFMIHAK